MKSLIITICIFLSTFSFTLAQNPSYQDKLIATCHLYGFMKYYHSEVSTCQVDWDKITSDALPLIKQDITKDSFNSILLNIIQSAGPTQRNYSPYTESRGAELLINLDYAWMSDALFNQTIKNELDTIRLHFRPHASCWVKDNDYLGDYTGWLVFPNDSSCYKNFIISSMPTETNRILTVFKYWNIVRYFSPNTDITDLSWDMALKENILNIATQNNAVSYYFSLKHMSSYLNDAHAEGLTYAYYIAPPTYYYSPMLILKYIEGKYMVVESAETGISRGFIVNKINNLSVQQMEDSLKTYLSSGNDAVFHRSVCQLLLNGYPSTSMQVEFTDNGGSTVTKTLSRSTYIYQNFFTSYYPNDTLKNVSYQKIDCNVAYVNMGNLQMNEVAAMYDSLKNSPAIIFDIRNYPNGTIFSIADLMFPNEIKCAKFKLPDVTYPGSFYWDSSSFGVNNNSTAYQGKVIAIVDAETQSHAEYTAMILKAFPGAKIVGSQTAGADGNITYMNAAWDIGLGYTGLGVYYPDGTNTQRTGIVPDLLAQPSRISLMARRDYVLEKALGLADCWVSGINQPDKTNTLSIYPNPGNGLFTLETEWDNYTIQVYDAQGQLVYKSLGHSDQELDLSDMSDGLYTLLISSDKGTELRKLIIKK